MIATKLIDRPTLFGMELDLMVYRSKIDSEKVIVLGHML
jgi:hypothetical protein